MAFNSITNYVRGSFTELTKVVWPTKSQAVKLTIIVMVFCLISALFLGALDYGFNELYTFILNKIA